MTLLVALLACSGRSAPDDSAPAEADADTDVDTDTDTDLVVTIAGEAQVTTTTYAGTESVEVTAGEDVRCAVAYELAHTGLRPDCTKKPATECDWAFDLEISAVSVTEGDCLPHLGDVSELEGNIIQFGLGEYYGHADTLMTFDADAGFWKPIDYIYDPYGWDEQTGDFSYSYQP